MGGWRNEKGVGWKCVEVVESVIKVCQLIAVWMVDLKFGVNWNGVSDG